MHIVRPEGLSISAFPKIGGTLLWGPYNKDPTIQGAVLIVGNTPLGTLRPKHILY